MSLLLKARVVSRFYFRMTRTRASTKVESHEAIPDVNVKLVKKVLKRRRSSIADDKIPSASGAKEELASPQVEIPATKKKRKGKARDIDSEAFLPRHQGLWKVGAHVSAAGGVENAVLNAVSIGANSFALFLKSQRKWESPALTEASTIEFKKRMVEYGYAPSMVLPHGSYLINLANPDKQKREKSYQCFVDDLQRCEQLGLELYNFHPGSTLGIIPLDEGLQLIAECINRAHEATSSVTIVLENMAGAGNIIGSHFEDLSGIIAHVKDQARVGVCLDTCHAFAAGFDIRTKEGWDAMMKSFEETVGIKYLRGMHINDSKTPCGSKKDRHENIGLGCLGIEAFKHILNDPRTQNIPLILETPSFEQSRDVWGKEIEVLQRLSGGTPALGDAFIEEIRQAVKGAESVKAKGKEAKGRSPKKKRKSKGKMQSDDDDNEEEEEEP